MPNMFLLFISHFFKISYDCLYLSMTSHLKKSIYEVIQKVEVKVKKLDDLLSLPSKQKIIMKLDVQGYEKEVLMGAIKNLKKIDYILVELSSFLSPFRYHF